MLLVVLNDWVTETKETEGWIKELDQLGEIGKRPGQPVDLVDDDDIDLAGPDLGEEALAGQGGPARPRKRRRHRSGRESGASPHAPGS